DPAAERAARVSRDDCGHWPDRQRQSAGGPERFRRPGLGQSAGCRHWCHIDHSHRRQRAVYRACRAHGQPRSVERGSLDAIAGGISRFVSGAILRGWRRAGHRCDTWRCCLAGAGRPAADPARSTVSACDLIIHLEIDLKRLKEKILGGLYGQALGDAWGMPAYFDPDQTWDAYGGWIEGFLPGPDDHEVHQGLPAGRITDDSEQAFSLARAYIAHGGVTLEATVEAIVDWYDRTG